MKTEKLFILVTLSVVCHTLNAQTNFTFTDLNGRTYSNANVRSQNPASILISWGSGGLARVDFTNLPTDIQTMLNYDPTNAAAFRKQQDDAEKAKAAAYEAAAPLRKAAQEEQARFNRVKATEHDVIGQVFQVTKDGALVNLYAGIDDATAQRIMAQPPIGVYDGPKTLVFLVGYNSPMVENEWLRLKTYPIGNYTYDAMSGTTKTILKITPNFQTALQYEIDQETLGGGFGSGAN